MSVRASDPTPELPGHAGFPCALARWIAGLVGLLGISVLIGWLLDVPALKSVLPGAVEMKANTAIALALASCSLYLHSSAQSRWRGRAAEISAALVAAIGLVTLLEYVYGWNLGIDELVFKDTGHAYNAIRGRMSPYSTVAFIALGVALAVSGRRTMRPLSLFGRLVGASIGLTSLVGYFWKARELTTDQWLPPVAIHTAIAFMLLGLGSALSQLSGGKSADPSNQSQGKVEAKVLGGFILALLLLCLGGGITYRMQANFAVSAGQRADIQEARTALGAAYAAVADAESAQRDYLLTSRREYLTQFKSLAAQAQDLAARLPARGLENLNARQRASVQQLQGLIARRMAALSQQIAVFDRDGNAAARRAIALDRGDSDIELIHETIATLDAHELELSATLAHQFARDRSYTLIALLGTLMVATVALLSLFGSILRDMQARARIAQALNRAQQDALKATQAKSQFLAAISHEIRTPMNGVIGVLEILQQSSLLDPQSQMVHLARESADSLLTIIDDILDFSKIEAGRLEIERLPICIGEVVEATAALLNRLAERKEITISLFCDPAIPERVFGDGTRVRQVLINLIGNAIKFSSGLAHPGHVSVRAEVAQLQSDRVLVKFCIVDNGIGMDEATQNRLFTSFMQADVTTTRRYGGTGLGLAISHQLVELMGGRITVDSALGRGASFTVVLPFTIAPADAKSVIRAPELTGLACAVIGEPTGLGDVLAAYLGHDGAQVSRLTDMAEACNWTRARDDELAIWIVEVHEERPRLDELLMQLRTQCARDVRVVLVLVGRKLRNPSAKAKGCVVIDGNALSRAALRRAVSLAAGRIRPEPEALPSKSTSEVRSPPSRPEAIRSRHLILVAEDNEINQRLIREQLNLLGYAVDVVADGRQALERWRSGDYALLFVDLHMPQMDGYDLTLAIRLAESSASHTPIVALTANALPGEAARCQAVGMDGYLTKPASLTQLSAEAQKWLGPWAPAAVDTRVLEALIGPDPRLIREFLSEFAHSAARLSKQLTAAFAQGDLKEVSASAHKLKSSARAVGASRLGEICESVESAAQVGGVESLRILVPDFEREVTKVQEFVQGTLAAQAPTTACA